MTLFHGVRETFHLHLDVPCVLQARLVVVVSAPFLGFTSTHTLADHSDGLALWQQLQQVVQLEGAVAHVGAAAATDILVCGQYHP